MNATAANYLKDLVEVKKITQRGHPEYGKYGVFATSALEACFVLGEYTGKNNFTSQVDVVQGR